MLLFLNILGWLSSQDTRLVYQARIYFVLGVSIEHSGLTDHLQSQHLTGAKFAVSAVPLKIQFTKINSGKKFLKKSREGESWGKELKMYNEHKNSEYETWVLYLAS